MEIHCSSRSYGGGFGAQPGRAEMYGDETVIHGLTRLLGREVTLRAYHNRNIRSFRYFP